MPRRALITGINGQVGAYLAELLLAEGYEVFGMVRRSLTEEYERLEHLRGRIHLEHGDLLDQSSIINLIELENPDWDDLFPSLL